MSLINVQELVTAYIRDKTVRDNFWENPQEVYRKYNINLKDQDIVEKLDLKNLDRLARNSEKERIGKRRNDFSEFSLLLSNLGIYDLFFHGFVRNYTTGLLTREEETERFLHYAESFIDFHHLPEIVREVLVYSYICGELSYHPMENDLNSAGFRMDKKVYLKRPYKIQEFKYDVVSLLEKEITSVEELEEIPKT
ncbi:hypothetical protein [Bacillus sp. FJAT-47783]|uniref:hypothetical protein n=1 Tax=Bacillus sp. FJAT-47783 TaxID=2922712 RepID=UPI001FABBEA3|nr:hypothetical protein [Bacillus sp. FJAT-47783]